MGVIFLGFSSRLLTGTGETQNLFWRVWDGFLLAKGHQYLAIALLVVTAFVVIILLRHRSVYDEYHTAILVRCLALAEVLTLAIIGWFFVLILLDPVGILSKMVLMISAKWC